MYRFNAIFIRPLFLLVMVWSLGFVSFALYVPEDIQAPQKQTDAIIVLTGGEKRLDAAVALLKEKQAKRLLISGVDKKVGNKSLARTVDHWPQDMQAFIDLGYVARNTRENSLEAKNWVAKNNFKSVRLVTSSYHMPRSAAEFKHVMPEVEIIEHPVFGDKVHSEKWWRSAITDNLVLGEYHKFMFAKLRIFIQQMLVSMT